MILFRTKNPTFHDTVFMNEMNLKLKEAHDAYDKLLFKEALKTGFFELQTARDKYRELCGEDGMCKDLVMQYIEWQEWIYNICGYYDRRKFVVKLGCYHLLVSSFIQQ